MRKLLLMLLSLVLVSLACSSPAWVPTPTIQPTPTQTSLAENPNALVTPAWTALVELPMVNVREKPSGKVIGTLSAGDMVTIKRCSGSWCEIKPRGFVWRGCLSDNPNNLGCQTK